MNHGSNLASGELLGKVMDHVEEALRAGRFDLRGSRKACLLLFLSGLENTRAFLHVSRAPFAFASVSNARSALEALIDSIVMLRDDSHLQRMQQDFLHKKKNALSASLKMMQKLDALNQAASDLQRQLNALNDEIASLSPRIPKKRREQLISEYLDDSGSLLTQWSVLCDVSHNNINSLAVRHLNETDQGEQIVLYAPLDQRLAEVIVITLSSLLLDVAKLLSNFLVSGQELYSVAIGFAQNEFDAVVGQV